MKQNPITHSLTLFISCLQDTFLSDLKALQPQLCITAAYGNILPTKFLDIPLSG